MGIWRFYLLLVTCPEKSLNDQIYSKRTVKSQGNISANLLPKRIRDWPGQGVITSMVCHIWYSLKLNINKKQSIKQQLQVLSQLVTLDISRDRFGRSYLGVTTESLEARSGLVGLWGFFVLFRFNKKRKNTQTKK